MQCHQDKTIELFYLRIYMYKTKLSNCSGKEGFQTIGISGMYESHVRNWEIVVDARLDVRMGSFSIFKIKNEENMLWLVGNITFSPKHCGPQTLKDINRIVDIETRSWSLTWIELCQRTVYPHVKCLSMTQLTVTKYVSVC